MSIRQPKPRQIRLPFSVPRPSKGTAPEARVCGICRVADSRYTCPRCNVAYCSLACFRDPKHTQCSEPFYKTTVMEQIAADPAAADTDKRDMLAMLRRFEEAAADGDDVAAALAEEADEDEDGLAAALEGVDLDTIDSNELLRLLPQAHRDAFLASLRDPDGEAARAMLDTAIAEGEGEHVSDVSDGPTLLPWWEADALDAEGNPAHAPLPPGIPEDERVLAPPAATKLVYNIVALCVAYVHTLLALRLPSLATTTPSQAGEARSLLLELAPFLGPSSVRYDTARNAWGGVWDRVDSLPPAALVRVLETVAALLHPPITTSPPRVAHVLDDVYALLCKSDKAGRAAAKKVAFYRGAMGEIARSEWLALEREVAREGEMVESEIGEQDKVERPQLVAESVPSRNTGPKIELLD